MYEILTVNIGNVKGFIYNQSCVQSLDLVMIHIKYFQ